MALNSSHCVFEVVVCFVVGVVDVVVVEGDGDSPLSASADHFAAAVMFICESIRAEQRSSSRSNECGMFISCVFFCALVPDLNNWNDG